MRFLVVFFPAVPFPVSNAQAQVRYHFGDDPRWAAADSVRVGPFRRLFDFALGILLLFAMGLVLSPRSAQSDREQGRLQQELAAAAELQHLLLPGQAAATPGFEVSPVYLPASEVGGDFFNVRPLARGGLLVVVRRILL